MWNGHDLAMKTGWKQVVKDLHIRVRDVLQITMVDDTTFELTVFASDLCEKHVPDNRNPKFIKWFVDVSKPKMILPIKWVNSIYAVGRLNDEVFINTSTGYTTNLKLEDDGKDVWFSDGWSKLVKDVDIRRFNILVFTFSDQNQFEMVVYDSDYIQRHVITSESSDNEESLNKRRRY
ncbi:B3 domain-containing protein At4g01580-like [Rutidosis leptorrhynchoides]|uniref:B3 domain-containing protein At4g01580-like n=1 Tax=Rutidosis leptorrhynchoides TaxID=125765 RepID=UPI003A996BD8